MMATMVKLRSTTMSIRKEWRMSFAQMSERTCEKQEGRSTRSPSGRGWDSQRYASLVHFRSSVIKRWTFTLYIRNDDGLGTGCNPRGVRARARIEIFFYYIPAETLESTARDATYRVDPYFFASGILNSISWHESVRGLFLYVTLRSWTDDHNKFFLTDLKV